MKTREEVILELEKKYDLRCARWEYRAWQLFCFFCFL